MADPRETDPYVLRSGSADVDPNGRDDWHWTGIHWVGQADGAVVVDLVNQELLVLPLSGSATIEVTRGGVAETFELVGRVDVWSGPSDALYVGPGATLRVHSGGLTAIASAVAERGGPETHVISPGSVDVATRGAGQMSRLVRGYAMPGAWQEAERLLVCEVITPGGNWSSYPAHKHDTHSDTERELEEIYAYQFSDGPDGQPGFGYHQTTSTDGDRPIDILTEVRSGDVVLVPHGWHGPCTAAPGHDMYYLNVMAGPVADGQWLISDHPDQTWVRSLWPDQDVDPRVKGRP